jgi:hypothetical protein
MKSRGQRRIGSCRPTLSGQGRQPMHAASHMERSMRVICAIITGYYSEAGLSDIEPHVYVIILSILA